MIHAELLDELGNAGYEVLPGQLGENITTRGLELLSLPVGARLAVGDAVIQVTGLRNPCQQINNFRAGLLRQVLKKDGAGDVVRLAGIMGMVARGGTVRPGDPLEVRLPPEPHFPLTRV
ncbi:MOSC domain-containing protein [Frankia sp. CN6]|uniref:MOSC domain-containing protein n=1 Tax=Frankia nepalensis TaxID=1836974 RepID=A0A937RAW2_9ACTN|nr:MOSC domain-containing protein [Frankia nepalensis]